MFLIDEVKIVWKSVNILGFLDVFWWISGVLKDLSLCLIYVSWNCLIIGKDDYDKDSLVWLLVGFFLGI